MIGSPDLLAFTGTEGFGGGEEDQDAIPEELSVPLLPPSNPWTSSAQFHRDFILVAEFSEQVGPKPVLTIPDDPRVIGSFDLNHFSVRIMSVDYQASGPGPVPPPSPGPRLNFSEDSRVILGDSAEDAFAYVHHMTLYDLEARGMVRPFCVAYVCSDQAKLMENFCELSTCFSQAADSLKTGNRQAFSMELQRKLQELEYTRVTLQQETEPQTANGLTESGEKAGELDAVERSISNHRDLLRQVTSYPNRKLKQPDFLPYDPADSLTDPIALLPPPEPCPSISTSTRRSEHRLKPLEELCNAYFLSLMKEQLADTERRLRGDRSMLRTARVTNLLSKRLTPINFLFELWSPEDGDEEEGGDAAEVELPRTTGTKSSVEAFQSEPMSLESFFSCVEEIPIKLEADEARTVTPDDSVATEMTGSVSSGDSIEVLGTEKSYRSQHVDTGSDSRADDSLSSTEALVGMTDTSYKRGAVDVGARRVRAYAKRANSEDSIEVLSTTESIIPDDLTAIEEEETEYQSLSNGFGNKEEALTDYKCDDVLKEEKTLDTTTSNERPVQEDDSVVDRYETLKQITVSSEITIKVEQVSEGLSSNQVHEDEPEKSTRLLQAEEAVDSTPQWPEVHQTVPDLHVNFAPSVTLAEVEQWSPPCAPLRLLSIDEASDCNSFTGSSDPPTPNRNIHSNTRSDRKRRRRAGLRALRFLKQNSFSQHAVFCLLSGRPLVVVGGDEGLVRKLVDALSLFLPAPGPERSAVMMYLTTPLQLTDLLTWRLMGIHRSPSGSSATILQSLTRYSRYLSLLDLDQRTLHCPSYSGSLISRLADPNTGISRGLTYLLHLESCLTALANQALLYTFHPALQRPTTAGGTDGSEKEDFLFKRGICSSESDLRVMHFLSDLIKQRHAGRGPPVLRFSYSPIHLHRNTHAA
ncbi:guanine nucleotide exchange protein smcr8b isoform X2 [Sparus aurata]|uniref:guanine nucleotide exchange protein smcr8b isoform X2 n=1 Tax=Sparus aurata TaxID=8175 RepID=UPI0011C1642A|nr:guanine nucleotide exchange protein smcr8a-like isoform X2 [Sparus aurata]